MYETLLYILLGLAVNVLIGVVVWASIDDSDRSLYAWYRDCPEEISWFAQPAVLMLWPLGLLAWVITRRTEK